MKPQEPYRYENPNLGQPIRPRAKIGLETPLVGRFWGENKRLIFAPPLWYDWFVVLVVLLGLWMIATAKWGTPPFQDPYWFLWVGICVLGAGVLALLSSERMVLDLRQRTYWRREGQGPFKRTTRGRLDELDAFVLQASEYPLGLNRTVIYRVVIFWKGHKEPCFIGDRQSMSIGGGAPLNAGAGMLLQKAMRYSKEAQLPLFDNSYFHSPDPLRLI